LVVSNHSHVKLPEGIRRAKEKNAAKLKTAAEEAQAEYLEANAKAERSEQFLGWFGTRGNTTKKGPK
jgi:hypothetical protein